MRDETSRDAAHTPAWPQDRAGTPALLSVQKGPLVRPFRIMFSYYYL